MRVRVGVRAFVCCQTGRKLGEETTKEEKPTTYIYCYSGGFMEVIKTQNRLYCRINNKRPARLCVCISVWEKLI
jgi:hypothetical protein